MKKGLIYITLIIVLTGIFFPVNTIYAQNPPMGVCTMPGGLTQDTDETTCKTAGGSWTIFPDSRVNGLSTAEKATGGSIWNWLDPLSWIPKILSMLVYLVMKILSFFLSLAGLLLNETIQITIMQMTDRINAMSGINVAWKVLRDLMNIGFIFMLLYQGIKLIISQDSIDSIRSFIIGIVLASLFINFSLFFTKVLIDTSNIATVGIYNTIVGDAESASTGLDRGLSNALMSALGIQSFFSYDVIATGPVKDNYAQLTANVMACILIIVSTIVFLAIAAMLITRYIVLILLLTLSPIAYMGMAFTGLKKYSDKWWETLWGQLIFAPLYMLMTWITLTLIVGNFTSKMDPIQLGAWSMAATTNIFFNYVLIIGLTIASLFIAKEYSTKGASEVGKMSSAITSFAGGAVMGGSAWAGRRGIGSLALGNSNKEELEQRVAEGGWQGRRAQARLALATSSFDARKTGIVEKVSKQTGVNFGSGVPFNPKAGEGGRAATVADNKKTYEANADAVVKRYTEKGDWAGLANYMKTGKPKTMSQADWEATQKYIYNKKLDARGRIALDASLADPALQGRLLDKLPADDRIKRFTDAKDWRGLANFIATKPDGTARATQEQADMYRKLSDRDRVGVEQSGVFTPPDIKSMRDSLPLDEQINVYRSRKNWAEMATFLKENPDGSTRATQEQNYIYEKLSTRDRVNLEGQLNDIEIASFRSSLPTEEEEKTEKEAKETKKRLANESRIKDINHLSGVAGITPTPGATLDTLIGPLGGNGNLLPVKEASNLSHEARMNPEVIRRLSPQHLRDLRQNGSLTDDEIFAIADVVSDPNTPYRSQNDHSKFINKKDQVDFWLP